MSVLRWTWRGATVLTHSTGRHFRHDIDSSSSEFIVKYWISDPVNEENDASINKNGKVEEKAVLRKITSSVLDIL